MKKDYLPILLSLTLAACGSKGANQGNDTQIGDDDGGETGDKPPPPPSALEDNGIAEYCVDRGLYHHLYDMDEVLDNEYWYHPLGRAYDHYLDLEDKPSPMSVPLACNMFLPHFEEFENDAVSRGGSPSCLSSGYHLQVPWVGTSDYIDPGHLQYPYSKDIIVGTVGNPPQSGRHTWEGPACCDVHLTQDEVDASAAWQFLITTNPAFDFFSVRQADCSAYVAAMGVHVTAMGYAAIYNRPTMLLRGMDYTTCVSGRSYNVVRPVTIAAGKVGSLVPYHTTRRTESFPANINYEFLASLGLISWSDFAAFGTAIDAVIRSLLEGLYLPPFEFQHARYKLGGGCHFPTALRWNDATSSTMARFTCPIGYYADFPSFSEVDPDFLQNGVVGVCRLDGVDLNGGTGLVGGGLISPHEPGGGSGSLDLDAPGGSHYYTVNDIDALGAELELAALGGLTADLAVELVGHDGEPFLAEDDEIAWWSSPWTPLGPAASLEATLGYDVDELREATNWSEAEAQRFVDEQGIVPLGLVIDGLPDALAARHANTLRARNAFHLRIQHGDEVHFIHLTARVGAPD